jgi:hypothetical protein
MRAIFRRVRYPSRFLGNEREGPGGSSRDSVDRSFLFAGRAVGVMKRLLVLSVVLGVGVVLGRLFDGVPVTAEAGGGGVEAQGAGAGAGVARNGDVNGDGNINIADASYLLNWLFLGGREPVPCPAGGRPAGLPDTGQSVC